jgi:hypothetical protein
MRLIEREASPAQGTSRLVQVDMTRRRRRVIVGLCCLLVLGFYIRSAWSYGKQVEPAAGVGGFQNLQADAFLAGQLHLTLRVPDGLTRLPDPYDPVANRPYRESGLHDLTFYDGKLHTYFGPAPVLLLFLPFRLLGLGDLPPALACLVLCLIGFVASVGVFRVLTRRFLRPLSPAAEGVAVLALGFAGPTGWLVYIGRGYEVSIAAGYAFVFGGLYCLVTGLFGQPKRPVPWLAVASFLLAAAVGARPNLFWFAAFVAFGLAYVRWSGTFGTERRWAMAALVGPYVSVALALGWYNWARFGSLTEFGTSYMLLGENIRLARANELEFLRRGLFDFLLSPARVVDDFPWFRLRPLNYPVPTEQNYLEEPVAGLLPNMPACLFGIVAFCAQPFGRLRRYAWLSTLIALLAATGFAVVAVNSYHFHGATMRYQMDYAPLLLLASVLGWFMAFERVQTLLWRRLWPGVAIVAVAWSAFFSVAITSYPCAGTGSC